MTTEKQEPKKKQQVWDLSVELQKQYLDEKRYGLNREYFEKLRSGPSSVTPIDYNFQLEHLKNLKTLLETLDIIKGNATNNDAEMNKFIQKQIDSFATISTKTNSNRTSEFQDLNERLKKIITSQADSLMTGDQKTINNQIHNLKLLGNKNPLSIGYKAKAERIERALMNVPVEERANAMNNPGVKAAMESHRQAERLGSFLPTPVFKAMKDLYQTITGSKTSNNNKPDEPPKGPGPS